VPETRPEQAKRLVGVEAAQASVLCADNSPDIPSVLGTAGSTLKAEIDPA
jgi:hypothetical protein